MLSFALSLCVKPNKGEKGKKKIKKQRRKEETEKRIDTTNSGEVSFSSEKIGNIQIILSRTGWCYRVRLMAKDAREVVLFGERRS